MYKLKKREDQISEEEWKHYFLDARHVADKNYGALTQAMKALKMDTEIPDAESRVVKLVSDFHILLDDQDTDEFPIIEPKLSVEFLCAAVEPSVLRVSVNTELKKAANKRLRVSVAAFLDWLKPLVESFLMFESTLLKRLGMRAPKLVASRQ
ncbi:uncharacterized protein IUM83_17045 [Phytophthora cinnamomi]|uniref:uncharacterized protein n=1 Tax=Phytophthora cinnamomi TaxID=4785 RepID=UPI0035593BEA|nr:hypothetical protein IUM83_17045 [Phytophthora cinnamomi]